MNTRPIFRAAHYETIAATVAKLPFLRHEREHIARVFSEELKADNPRFKPDLFMKAVEASINNPSN